MSETIRVASTKKDNDGRVILWEKDKLHPTGECFVANDGIGVEVYPTPAIKRLIAEGELERTSVVVATPAPVVETDEDEDEVISLVTETKPAPVAVTSGGINRGGRPPRRGQ